MSITRISAAISKETRLLTRDLHGLALLFILPLAFILVMSLALQDAFASRSGNGVEVAIIDLDDTPDSLALIDRLGTHAAFDLFAIEKGADLKSVLDNSQSHVRRGPACWLWRHAV